MPVFLSHVGFFLNIDSWIHVNNQILWEDIVYVAREKVYSTLFVLIHCEFLKAILKFLPR